MIRKGYLLLGLVLCGPGCLSPGSHVETESRQAPQVRMTEAPPPPVTADQVSDANASEIVQALSREMDYETNNQSTGSAIATTMANTMKP
jgi:hypothetical protein